MNLTCPSCGANMDLDVALAHEESRRSLARMVELLTPMSKTLLQYLRLFKPATRQMGQGRTVTLLEELMPDLQRGKVHRNGRDWDAPQALWQTAIERMLDLRDQGKLTLPLKSHGYLYEILGDLANKAEATAETGTEEARRNRVVTGADDAAAPVATVLVAPPVAIVPGPVGPSAYALKVRAQIEADRKRREAMSQPAEDAP